MAVQLGEIELVAVSVKAAPPSADFLNCLPAILISRSVQVAAGSNAIGGEDCSSAITGASTGDISAKMLQGVGVSGVIVGHSERRQHHDDTDAIFAFKARAARCAGLLAVICIGETQSQQQACKDLTVCGDQVAGGAPEGATSSDTAIGYEPP